MKKTIKDAIIEVVYPFLAKAKSTKMTAAGRRAVFNVMYEMQKRLEDYSKYKQELIKSLMPENSEEVAHIVEEFNALPESDKPAASKEPRYAGALKINNEFETELQKGFDSRESELDIAPLTDDVFYSLCDSNPEWEFGRCIALKEMLCEEEKTETEKK